MASLITPVPWHRGAPAPRSYVVLAIVLLQFAGVSGAMSVRRGLLQAGAAAMYCVAKPEAETKQLQEALDWTCGKGETLGSVNCEAIQKGGACFEPDSLVNHASYAFTLYYTQQSAAPTACDFKGLATLTNTNPSSGTCIYPTSASTNGTNPNISNPAPPIGGAPGPFIGMMSPAPSPSGAPSHPTLYFGSLVLVLPFVIMLL